MDLCFDVSNLFRSSLRVIMQHPTSTDIQRVREFLLDLQARICAGLEQQEKAGGGTGC